MIRLLLLLCPPFLLPSLWPALCRILQQCFGAAAVWGDCANNCSSSRWPPRPTLGTVFWLRGCCCLLMTSATDEIFVTFKCVHRAQVPDSILPASSSLLALQGIVGSTQQSMRSVVKIVCVGGSKWDLKFVLHTDVPNSRYWKSDAFKEGTDRQSSEKSDPS